MKTRRAVLLLAAAAAQAASAADSKAWSPRIPKVWDEAELASWVTPVAGLNVRPAHIPAKEYYSMPEYNLRSYPVYVPGREPQGYWEMLQRVGPEAIDRTGQAEDRSGLDRGGSESLRRGNHAAVDLF